ncbi:hypothetical protein J6590_055412 [Homalodisca vitripennis]|nr:hypothetical protein J6590_055412 [Homalodisca vitripennis]
MQSPCALTPPHSRAQRVKGWDQPGTYLSIPSELDPGLFSNITGIVQQLSLSRVITAPGQLYAEYCRPITSYALLNIHLHPLALSCFSAVAADTGGNQPQPQTMRQQLSQKMAFFVGGDCRAALDNEKYIESLHVK